MKTNAFALLLVTLCVGDAWATNYTWVGTANANWNAATSWSPAGGPPATASDTGTIGAGQTAKANADLGSAGNRPTITIQTGGRVNQGADIGAPIALDGGTLKVDGYMNTASPIALPAASMIEKVAHCCGGKDLSGQISGAGKLTIYCMGWYPTAKEWNITGNNTFTGGADFRSDGADVEVYIANAALGANGSTGSPNTLSIYPNFRLILSGGGTLTRDFTLAGGTLDSRHRDITVTGALTLSADSRVQTDGCCNGGGLTIDGAIKGPYRLVAKPLYNNIRLKTNSPEWTGGLTVTGTQQTVVQTLGAQGAGPILLASGTLTFDAATSQNWTITNALSGAGTVRAEAGDGTHRLSLCGTSLAPGGNNTGKITVDGKFAMTNAGAQYCTMTLDIANTNGVAGTDFDQLVVDHGDTLTAASLANVDLSVAVAPTFAQLSGQTLVVISAPGVDFTGKAFRSVTWYGDAGTVLYQNGSVRIQFTASGAAPIVTNDGGANGIRVSRATLRGQVTQGSPPPLAYICWGDTPGGTTTSSWQHTIFMDVQNGNFSQLVTGLQAGQTYHYRCFATNEYGGDWADTATNFTALSSMVWTFTNHNANWSLASSWTPTGGPPQFAGERGIVPAGKTAVANADLGTAGDRPTVTVETGGRVNQTAGDLYAPIVLTGGVFKLDNYVNTYSPITLNAASTIEKRSHCCNGKSLSGPISGGGKLTFLFVDQYNYQFNIDGNNTFSGGVDFLAGPTYTGRLNVGVNALGANGPPASPNTVRLSTNVVMVLGGSVIRDFTLDGGTLSSENNTPTVTGTLTLTASSRLMTAGFLGSGLTVQGAIQGAYEVLTTPGYQSVTLNAASPLWTGGLYAGGTAYKTVIGAAGAQGAGPLRVSGNSTLAFDAVSDQDWFVTNDVASASGATGATVQVESGVGTTRTLTLCGRSLAPGGTNGIGILRVNGRFALAAAGGQRAAVKLGVNGTQAFNGANAAASYDRVYANGGALDFGNQELRVTLGATCVLQSSDTLDIVLNDGTDAVAGTFYGAPEGGTVSCPGPAGQSYLARITYAANADGGAVGNDVRLYDFERNNPTVFVLR